MEVVEEGGQIVMGPRFVRSYCLREWGRFLFLGIQLPFDMATSTFERSLLFTRY